MRFCRRFWYYVTQKIQPFFDVNMDGKKISGLPTPTEDSEAARKKYVDDQIDGDMEKATYDIGENGIVDNSEKLEGSSKTEVQDHVVKEHALSSHSDPSADINIGGKKITHIADPTADQHIATKKYVDDLFEQVTPADIPIFPWSWTPGWSEATIRSQFSTLSSLGINAFISYHHQEDYRDNPAAMYWYDMVYDLAEEYGIKVFWYTSTYRYKFTNPNNGQVWINRYKVKPACGGWMFGDEPAARGDGSNWPYDDIKATIDEHHGYDLTHPTFAVWTASIYTNWYSQYLESCHKSDTDNWCKLYDVGSVDIYPYTPNAYGLDWLAEKIAGDHIIPPGDGWGDCGKGIIPCMQAFHDTSEEGEPMPDDGIVLQYNVWKTFYGYSGIKGVGLYHAGDYIFAAGDQAEKIRNMIKDLARLRGWGG